MSALWLSFKKNCICIVVSLGSDASIPTTTLIFGGMGGLVLILIVIVVILVLRRRAPPPSERNHNKEIGMDNIGKDASDYPTMKEKSSIVA